MDQTERQSWETLLLLQSGEDEKNRKNYDDDGDYDDWDEYIFIIKLNWITFFLSSS